MKDDLATMLLRLPLDLRQRLKVAAAVRRVTMCALATSALEQFLSEERRTAGDPSGPLLRQAGVR